MVKQKQNQESMSRGESGGFYSEPAGWDREFRGRGDDGTGAHGYEHEGPFGHEEDEAFRRGTGYQAEPGYLRNAYRGRGSRGEYPGERGRWGRPNAPSSQGYDWSDDGREPWDSQESRLPIGPGGYRESMMPGRFRYEQSGPEDYRGLTFGERGYGLPGGGYGADPLVDRDRQVGQERQAPFNDYRGRGPKGYRRTDDRICEDVCESLSRDPYVDASTMDVSVNGGIVRLEGEASSRRVKHRAENCADRCSGVMDVENHLKVRRSSSSTTGDTQEKTDSLVDSALDERGSR